MLLSGCSTITVTTDYDPNADFSSLRTYDWLSVDQSLTNGAPEINTTFLGARLRTAVDRELAAKGFRLNPGAQSDFYVVYHVVVSRNWNVDIINDHYHYVYPPRWGRYPGGRGIPRHHTSTSRVEVYHYDEGTLIIDIVDADAKTLLWRGHASAVVDVSANSERRQQTIDTAVGKLLVNFPPS